jgi:benzil reductase ((S)-benzoin forming)
MSKNLAIVTGGSKGLGYEIVQRYLKKGWVVKFFSRSGKGDCSIPCDFSDREVSVQIVAEVFERLATTNWDRIVVVNNAGTINPMGPIEKTGSVDWFGNLDVNLLSAVSVTGYFLKYFQSHVSKKYIVFISSGAARSIHYGWSLYCASKAALESFSRCVALEQSSKENGAIAFVVNPGMMDTEMQEKIRKESKDNFLDVDRFKGFKLQGRLAPPKQIAAQITEIIESNPVNGQLYSVSLAN